MDTAPVFEHLRITWMGRLIYSFLPYRRRVIFNNMTHVFGDTVGFKDKKKLAKAFYSHVATSLKETLCMRFMSEQKLKEAVLVRGVSHLWEVASRKKGILVLTCHVGNWEFAPIGAVLHYKEFQGRFHFIRRPLVNKKVERIVFKRYYQAGLNVIHQRNALQETCLALEKNHVVVFVLDQHASLVNRDGIAVEFFGEKAGTYRGLASIARYTGADVVPAGSYRLPNGKHVLEFYEPIAWQDGLSGKDELYYNTLAYNKALEKIILAHPEQWSWFHKRWKLRSDAK